MEKAAGISRTLISTLLFALFVAVVLGFFLFISGTRAPYIPGDSDHRGIQAESACRDCHAPGRLAPLKPKHPPKDLCFKCHKRKKKTA